MTSTLRPIVRRIAFGVAIFSGISFVISIIGSESVGWSEGSRAPVFRVADVVAGDDAVFISLWYSSRVYKFDYTGRLLRQFAGEGGVIRLSSRGHLVVAREEDREWELGRLTNESGVNARVEHTWWGHPVLVVERAGSTRQVALQPVYITLFRSPYPGVLWFVVALISAAVARIQ